MKEAMEKTEFKQTEVGLIPRDWVMKPIGDIVIISVGRDLKKVNYSKDQDSNYKYPVYSNTISNEGLYGFYNISEYSGESLTVVGRGVGLGTAFKRNGKYGAIGRLLVLMPHKNIDAKYLTEFINYKINIFFESSGVPQLTGISFAKYKVALPPTKAEQTAIATALNDADALITQLEKLIAKKRNIKQGAMQELLKPKVGWVFKRLGDIFKFLNTANNSRADLLESGEVEYIHYGDIHTRWNCFLDCSKNELPFIDKTKVISDPFLENGDLVVADASEDYEGLGACIEIKNIWKRKIVAGLHTLLLRGDKNVLADGFKGYLRNYQGVKDAMIRVSTGVSVFGISKTNLKEIEILIPSSIEEQNRIAQILSDMDAEIEALEKKLDKYKMLKQGMMQNLLTGKIRLV